MIIKDDYKEPKIFDEMQPEYMTLKQLKSIYLANADIKTGPEATIEAAGQSFRHNLKESIFAGLPTFAGQVAYKAGEKMEEIGQAWKDRFFDEENQIFPKGGEVFNGNALVKAGKELQQTAKINIRTANRNLQMMRDEFRQNAIPISREEQDSLLFSVASQALDYPVQLGLAYLNPMASIGYLASRVLGGETVEGMDKYSEGMGDIVGFEKMSGEELGLNVANAVVQSVWERAFGAPAQLKNFMNSKGMLKLFGQGFTEEFATENLQTLTDAIFDDFSNRLDKDETVGTRLAQNFRDSVVAGMFGGTSGTAFAIHNRSKGIDDIAKNLLGESVPDNEKIAVATAIYDNGVNTLQGLITTELETSSSLRAHHGEVYQSMFDNVLKAVRDAKQIGAFATLDESDLARYANTEAKRFADQVLAEATMRKKPVAEVFSASDVSYENGKLSLRINGVNTEVSGQDVAQGALEQAMYKSKLETIEQFIDDVFNSKDTSARYFTITSNSGVAFDLPRDTVLHDKKHNLSSSEWKEVAENIDSFESVSLSDKSIYNGQSVLLKVKTPSGKYGVVFEHMPKGRNIITTAFKDTDANIDNWIKNNSARAMQKAPTTQKGLLSSRSIADIISNLDNNVNSSLKQQALFQESLDVANQNAELDANNPAYEGETININGVERTVYNSNGDRIAMSEPALRNFYNWFGDSKVIDKEGRPLVMYHGTNKKFEEFDKSFIGKKHKNLYQGKGFYFTKEYYKAQNYGRKIMPVYLKIENPALSDYDLKPENDGIYAGQGVYVVFNPNQIKSTSNRGTYDPNDDRIYYQGGEERNLVAVHSISASNLEKAIDLGGFPVPSIAIIKKDQEFHFDNQPITLVGNKDLINPKNRKNEVYDRDIWSATFPHPSHKKANIKDIRKFENEYEEIFAEVNANNQLSSIVSTMQRQDPTYAINEFIDSDGAKAKYIKDVLGKKLEIPVKDRGQEVIENSFMRLKPDDQFFEDVKNVDRYPSLEENKNILAPAVDALISRMDLDSDRKADLKEVYIEEDGVPRHIADRIMYGVYKYNEVKGKLTSDIYETKEYLNSQIENPEEYAKWAEKEVEDKVIGEKFIEVGKSLKPITLENIVLSMTKKQTKNSQNSLVFGTGKVIAGGAKRLNSIKEIKIASEKLVSKEVSGEKVKQLSEDLMTFSDNFAIGGDMLSQSNRREAVFKALASVAGKENPTKSDLNNALNYEIGNKKEYSDDVLEAGINLINSIRNLSRYYFEAKPQRAVGLNEFSGAIIPTDASFDEIAKKVEDNGLKVVRSDNQIEAMKQFDEVFFQDRANDSKGANASIEILGDTALISLFKTADAHSLPHELSHYWLDAMFKYVKSGNATPEYMKRWNAIAKYLNIRPDQERLTRKQQEIWATGYETYLNTQVAPVPVIRGLFDDYNRWLQRVYRELKTNPQYTDKYGQKHDIKLTDEMIEVFNSMTTGEFIARPDVERMASKVTPALERAVVDMETRGVAEIQKMENATTYPSTIIKPTKSIRQMVRGEAEEAPDNEVNVSSVALRELGEAFGYQKKNIAEEYAKAEAWVRGNLARAKEVVYGKAAPDGLLSTAINIAYVREMENMGNYVEAQKATRMRSFEQTLRGQEIAMERVTTDDALSMSYWTSKVLARKENAVANKFFKNDVTALRKFIDKESKALAHELKGKSEDEKRVILNKRLQELSKEYGTTLYQTNEDLPDTYDSLYVITRGMIEDSMGISVSDEQTNEISSNVEKMLKMFENSASSNGNPSIETFKKLDEMNKLIDSYSPTNQGVIWSSIYGRSAMLASIKSPVTNIVSNIENTITEKFARTAMNVINGKTNDNIVSSDKVKNYIKWSDDVYAASGYMPSVVENIFEETPKTLGESRPHSQGKGFVRAVGRIAENAVFKQLMGRPDNFAKSVTFADVAGNKATQVAYEEGLSGEEAVSRANELFDDAILVNPKTEAGQQIRKEAMEAAHQTTYTQDSKLAEVAFKIREVLNTIGGKNWKMGDMLMPFVRTPANVISTGLDYAIGSFYTAYNVKNIIQDPTSEVSQRAIRSAVRNGEGMLLALVLSAFLDDEDYIPEFANLSPKMREMVKLQGGVYNSVKLFGHWISLDYFGPLGVPLAGIMKARQRDGLMNSLFAYGQGTIEQLLKVPGFREASQVIASIQDIGAYNKTAQEVWKDVFDWTTDQAYTRTVPAFVNDIGKFLDTYERETDREMSKRIISKIPFLRETLPAKTSLSTGGRVETEGLKELFFGSRVSKATDNRFVGEVENLMEQGSMPSVSDPTRYGKLKDLPVDKKNQARAYFNAEYNKQANRLMSRNGFNRMKPEEKKKAFDKIRREITEELKKKYKLK